MKATIELKGMKFHAFHGCLESERRDGGDYLVDFSCGYDVTRAAETDSLSDTLDYSEIYGIVSREMETPSNLLEHLAARIAEAISERHPELEGFSIKVTKLNPPTEGPAASSSVTLII